MVELTRRDFLKVAGAGALMAGLGPLEVGCVAQEARDVPILGIFPYTGSLAQNGPSLERGMALALEEEGNRVLNRPIKFVKRDSETKADAATRRTEEAIDSEGVRFVIGPWSSGVALAVSEVAKRRKVVHLFSGGTEDISGKRCHRYSFQWASHPYNACSIVVSNFVRLNPNAKRWYLFISDYAFGWSIEKYVKLLAAQHGVQIVGVDRHPLGEREFSGYMTKAIAANPDALVTATVTLDAVQMVRTAFNFGFTPQKPIVLTWAVGDEIQPLQPEMRENLWIGMNYFYQGVDTPVSQAFVRKYQERFGQPPDYPAGAGYAMTRLLLSGIKKANSLEPAEVVKALEGIQLNERESLIGPMMIDPKTHQNLRDFFFFRCKKKAEMKDDLDVVQLVGKGRVDLPADIIECKDIGQL